ncbi:MAG: helix-turn-helix domain-containing protein [Ruminococcus sp.]|nr:helix-turn-helix domain-containing protein [Ruminococcus sp.]
MNLGERYKNLRLALTGKDGEPMSAKEFAKDVVGLATTRVSELENNKREMSLTELKAYHNGLGVSFEYLLGETDTMTINEDIQTACKVTGLSECAVITLSYIDDEITQILNHLLVEMEYGAGDIPKGMLYDLYLYFTIPQIDENDFLKITLNGEIHTGNDNKKSVKTHWKSLFTVHEVNKRDIIDKVLFDSLCDAIRISRYNFLSDINQGDNENG